MKKSKSYISAIAAIVLLGGVNLSAVQYDDSAVVIEHSSAVELENKFQEEEPSLSAVRVESGSESAYELAENFLQQKGIQLGWNPKNQSIVVIESALRDMSDDPSYNSAFMNIRNTAAIEAVLRSKTSVIKAIRSSMSAEDILIGPGSNLDEELSKDLKNVEKKLKAQKREVIKLLKAEKIAYQEVEEGVTFKDRYNAFFDAVIKKLDDKYDTKKIEENKRKKYDRIKKALSEANQQYDKTQEKLAKLKGTIKQEQTSTREIFSQMPLFGATVVEQFESYNEDTQRYENAVIMMWSPKTEAASRAMLSGKDLVVPPGKESFNSYLNSNKENWLTTTGGRRFRDDQGEVYFLGVGSQEIGGSASADRKAMSMAKIEAQTQVAFALFADVKTQETMTSKEVIRNGGTDKDFTQSLTSLAENLSQSIKNIQLQGVSQVFTTKGIHPLTQNQIFVSVFAISAKGAKAAIKAEASSYMSKLELIDSQKKSQARKDRYEDDVVKKEESNDVYEKEYKNTKYPEQTKVKTKVTKKTNNNSTKARNAGGYGGVSSDDGFSDW